MERRTFLKRTVLLVAASGPLVFGRAASAEGDARIHPDHGESGDAFRILDPQRRLIPGARAVFESGPQHQISTLLETDHPFKVARGLVPDTVSGGTLYDVSVLAGGAAFPVGQFLVTGTYTPPSLIPTQGPTGTLITIDDAEHRIRQGDVASFYPPGGDPLGGTPGDNTVVASDGSMLTADVPLIPSDLQYAVAVVSMATSEVRFSGLAFYLTI